MTRRQLLEILRAIQRRPQNASRDIMAMAERCTGPGDLAGYVLARWMELRDPDCKVAVARVARAVKANASGFPTVLAAREAA